MKRALPIAIAIFVVGVVTFAVSQREPPPRSTTTPVETPPPSTVAFSVVTGRPLDRVATIDNDIAFYRARGEADPHAWLDWEFVAQSYVGRARLTGDYNDFRHAEEAFDRCFAAGGVAFLSRASFNLTMHRIDRVDADLDRAERGLLSRSDSDALLAMRADARYYAGRYADAREIAEANVVRSHRSVDALVSLAQFAWHTGDVDTGVTLMDEALAHPSLTGSRAAPTRAWVLLTRAMLDRDRGHFDDALARLDEARALDEENTAHVDELAAEIREASGDLDGALTLFRELSTTARSPQSIDGVARILRQQGDTVAAAELIGVARQAYEGQMALFPEAAWGHAIDHWLRLEPDDVDRMIAIAEGNARARPYGETRVKLAMAYVLANRIPDARRELDEVLATEWSTPELHAVNAIVIAHEAEDPGIEHGIAEEMAPGITQRTMWLDDP